MRLPAAVLPQVEEVFSSIERDSFARAKMHQLRSMVRVEEMAASDVH